MNKVVYKILLCKILITIHWGCAPHTFVNLFSEDRNYDFRNVRWGFTQEAVEFSEMGKTIRQHTQNALVYRHKIAGVPCQLIYTFKNNKLRMAGYATSQPVKQADNLLKAAVEKHGMPTSNTGKEMIWNDSDLTVIYAKTYESVRRVSVTRYTYSDGGLLRPILQKQLAARPKTSTSTYLDGVLVYVDRDFYNELHEKEFPLEELSFYEKQLMGIVITRHRTDLRGQGITIPR